MCLLLSRVERMVAKFRIRISGSVMITEIDKWLIGKTMIFYNGSDINGSIMTTEIDKWLIGKTILFYNGSDM
jgi:hypothetical protein